MGYFHNGTCYASLNEASASFCRSVTPSASYEISGSFQEVHFFCNVGSDGLPIITRVIDYWDRSVVWGVPHTIATDFSICDPQLDIQIVGVSISLFYLFLGILVAVWGMKRIYSLFNGVRQET